MNESLNTSQPLTLRLKLEQTKHRMNIIKLQPALRTIKVLYYNLNAENEIE